MPEASVWGDKPLPCIHLRRKSMYIVQAQSEDNPLYTNDMAEPHWCLKTMGIYGPDGDLVDPKECREGRECYESGF